MRILAATLAIVACFGSLVLGEIVNGDEVTVTLISSDGEYMPGSIGGWNAVFNKVREFTEPEGLDALQAAQNLLVPIDEVLRKRDLSAGLKLARECSQLFNIFIPHVTNKDLQQYLIDGNVRIGHFIDSVEKQGPTLFAINTFLSAEFKNIGGVLKALLLKVGNLVHNVASSVGGVVHNVGGLVDGLLHRLG